ncbi:MAG: CehA/McbA family metallohydrolase [Acidobacteria bacterium]|nr:CehA/McbA family metallohydrolase [Acidobacteriota bacterium]
MNPNTFLPKIYDSAPAGSAPDRNSGAAATQNINGRNCFYFSYHTDAGVTAKGRRTALLCVLALFTAGLGLARELELRILDEKGHPAAARVRLRDSAGKLLPVRVLRPTPAIVGHPKFPDLGVVVDGLVVIDLPAGNPRILVDRQTEYRTVTLDSAKLGPTATVRLKRWIDMAKLGWWSGDPHVHREPAEMPLLIRAADLHIAPVLTRWNDTPGKIPWTEPLETTVDTIGYWPPRDQRYLELDKPIWWASPIVALLAQPDSVGVVNNHFLEESMFDNEAWGRPRDRSVYSGLHGFADYTCMLYARYLSTGLRLAASAGSANGVMKNGLGYNRVYVYLDGPFSPQSWWNAQKAGRSFATNGPMLWLLADGQRPGAILPESARSVRVKLEARSQAAIDRIELLVDGEIVQTFRPGSNTSHLTEAARVNVEPGSWIAARCFEKNEQTVRLAHTSPVYVGATPRRSPQALAWMREWITAYREHIRKVPDAQLSAAQKVEFQALCDRAEAALR